MDQVFLRRVERFDLEVAHGEREEDRAVWDASSPGVTASHVAAQTATTAAAARRARALRI